MKGEVIYFTGELSDAQGGGGLDAIYFDSIGSTSAPASVNCCLALGARQQFIEAGIEVEPIKSKEIACRPLRLAV